MNIFLAFLSFCGCSCVSRTTWILSIKILATFHLY